MTGRNGSNGDDLNPLNSRLTPRERLFPEIGDAEAFSTLYPYFDPFIFFVNRVRPPFAEEHDLIMRGEFEAAKKLTDAKFLAMSPDERMPYLFAVTSGLHEVRHFHDYFGTTAGFTRLLRVIEDAHEFTGMWHELIKRGKIKLPLAVWGMADDAPKELKEYLSKRRAFVEWINVFDGSLQPATYSGKCEADEGIVCYSVGGLEAAIPVVPRNFQRASNRELFHKMTPLGYQALTEGSAFVIQRMAVREVFGAVYADQMKQALMSGPVDHDYWQHYMTVDIYLTKRLTNFYERYQLALTDIALMAEDFSEPKNGHPGWRLSMATAVAKGLDSTYRTSSDADLAKYMDRITNRVPWKSLGEVANNRMQAGKDYLDHLDKRNESDSLWSLIMRAAHHVHLQFIAAREATPDCLAAPEVYLGMLKHWPPPPMSRTGGMLVFRGLNDEDSRAFRTWVFFEHAQRHLLFSTRLPCPMEGGSHDCPGDPFGKPWIPFLRKRWEPSTSCAFSQFANQLGVADVETEFIST